jgi:nucleoside-diphosphate-sugar epimerase
MHVMVVGASGAIGTRLVSQLTARGHEVTGTFRSPGKDARIRALGARPVALDLLDAAAVRKAVLQARPDAIVHEATALAGSGMSRSLDKQFAQTNRLRTDGTDNLLTAARGRRQSAGRAELRPIPVYPPGRVGEDRGRPARPGPAQDGPPDLCRDDARR